MTEAGPATDRPGAARLDQLVTRVADPSDPLDRDLALGLVAVADVEAIIHPGAHGGPDPAAEVGTLLGVGLAASPGVAQGSAVFDGWRALDAVDEGRSVILVTPETSPADEPALSVVVGVVTSRGGMGSHAAVIARGRGLPAVCGAHTLDIGPDSCTTDTGEVVREGDEIAIDGSTGEIRRSSAVASLVGAEPSGSTDRPDSGAERWPGSLVTVLGWADERRGGQMAVLANADSAADAARARDFGAEGIGLCRTEHQFLAADRLDLLRRLILAPVMESEVEALAQLIEVQRHDFAAVLRAMDGLPVTVRLLDPPLHEFLPDLIALERDDAAGGLDDAGHELLAAARRWHEHDPMLGVRGVRLAVLKPALYRMQVRALLTARADVAAEGGTPRPRILVPLVSSPAELVMVRGWIDEELAPGQSLAVGAMIETPRAALVAGPLAQVADFLSFGTNDLTQLTFGLSRDDAGRILDAYRSQGLTDDDPFATLDDEGVGALVRLAVDGARRARPEVSLGICGEHGGDPASIERFLAAGLDSVSCSPFRVPVARLAVAHALGSPMGAQAGTTGDPDRPPRS
jgi:pyruvate, orthophosphate dikinase